MTPPAPLPRSVQRALQTAPFAINDPAALRAQHKPQLRRYEVLSLRPGGGIAETCHVAPALQLFEDAFCAFSRGSMVETETGLVAVEDLLPGDRIITGDGTAQPLLWKGRTTLVPGRPGSQGRNLRLTRIMADSFGIQRPMSYVLAGPSARLLNTPDHLRAQADGMRVLTPVQQFQDGMNVIETAPPTAVELFHICLPRHAVIRVAGLEFETYHPGPDALRTLSPAMRAVYLNLFPHIDQCADFGDLAHARAGDGPMDARDT
ncbi:Hint domain-containing protein [Sedimentitalea nanhaiensis]|uniref:Hint domain-containing protein n=1 Tax=Sedimentitalea nanhaiensis TaxID=999627 RepID=A0A1I7CFJ9_9RHOB|nr:Hint domain-containing protein [Sedimentitalea nanhaiensis]SFT98172.1 Hint domain-containing protein [Sedimentitalea nanhaiensis]